MDNKELHEWLITLLGVDIPEGTIRRWVYDGIIPRPTSVHKGKGGGSGRFSDWPPETVEQAAIIYILRHSDTAWAKPTNKAIIETKKVVDAFYSIIDEYNSLIDEYDHTGNKDILKTSRGILERFDGLSQPVTMPDGRRGMMLGGYELGPLIINWIVTREKIRHSESLFAPRKVVFNWCDDVAPDGEVRTLFKGVTLEQSDRNILSWHEGTTDAAKKVLMSKKPANGARAQDKIFDLRDYDNVEYDVENQRIIVTDSKREEKFTLNLKGSGVRLVKDDPGS